MDCIPGVSKHKAWMGSGKLGLIKEDGKPPSEGTGDVESGQSTVVIRTGVRRSGGGLSVGIQCRELVEGCLCPAVRIHLPVEPGHGFHVVTVTAETPKQQAAAL